MTYYNYIKRYKNSNKTHTTKKATKHKKVKSVIIIIYLMIFKRFY